MRSGMRSGMDVRAIKHAAKLSEWSERIRACRSSGKQVKTWCEENGINVKSYYRWERLYIAEASMQMQLRAGQGSEAGALVRIEPEKLPVTRTSLKGRENSESYGVQGIILRHGGVELELPEGMAIGRIAELVKALSGV